MARKPNRTAKHIQYATVHWLTGLYTQFCIQCLGITAAQILHSSNTQPVQIVGNGRLYAGDALQIFEGSGTVGHGYGFYHKQAIT